MTLPPRTPSTPKRAQPARPASEEAIRGRAIELAVLSGRSLHQVTESDRDAARRELGGNS